MSFRKEEHLTETYLKINPNGVVPSLVHDGTPITDSSCIIEYLDEAYPEVRLSPETAQGRAKMRAWLRFMEEVPTAAVRIPSFEQVFLPSLRIVQSKKAFNKATGKRTIRQGFYEEMKGGQGFDDPAINNSIRQLMETVNRMDKALTAGDWIMGDALTLVDFALTPLIDRIDDLGMSYLWSNYPRVQSWLDRMRGRPSFAKAFYKGSRLSERLEFKIAFVRDGNKRKKFRQSWSSDPQQLTEGEQS
jgi:glutathione S-transferase